MANAVFIVRLYLMLVSGVSSQSLTWYIKPDTGENRVCSHLKHCSTLDNIINNLSNGSAGRHVTLFLLPGTHLLSTAFELSNIEQLSLHGLN